jgi:hypothetical protein
VGYLAVYRLCFALSAFFFLMALIMTGVKTSKDPRAGIQNGFVLMSFNLDMVLVSWDLFNTVVKRQSLVVLFFFNFCFKASFLS